ncbi:hypothetical protein [Nonomuraea sp. NPDC003201]
MSTLAERLRAGARDAAPYRIAAVELLIADPQSAWLDNDEFLEACVTDSIDQNMALIDWENARDFFDTGAFDAPIGDGRAVANQALLDFAITLAEERFNLIFMNDQQRRLIVTALAQATQDQG